MDALAGNIKRNEMLLLKRMCSLKSHNLVWFSGVVHAFLYHISSKACLINGTGYDRDEYVR